MLTIGLLGGLGGVSTTERFGTARVLVREGGPAGARVVLLSGDVAGVAALQDAGRSAEAGALLAREAQRLQAAGADLLLVGTDTGRTVADQVAAGVAVPVLHLVHGPAAAGGQGPAGEPGSPRPRLLPDLFHVADAGEWATPDYPRSSRGLDLADVGFVHLAFAWQVQGVLDRFYADADGPLVLLRVDPDLLADPVRVEPLPGSTEGFPHLYGPLRPSAVVEQVLLRRGPHGWQAPAQGL